MEEPQLLFDIAVHGGTLIAVILVYWSDIRSILQDLVSYLTDRLKGESFPEFLQRSHCRLALWIAIGTIPIGIVGFTLRRLIEPLFASSLAVGLTLMVTGTVLWLTVYSEKGNKTIREMGLLDAIWVGVAQSVALIPGISRSGVTVSASLFRGLDRELSSRFSFLLMIPATVGALVAPLISRDWQASFVSLDLLLGTLASFGTGYVSLRLLIGVIRRGRFYRFAYYCWGVGGVTLILSFLT